nr:MAG TPA: hypothetical protein [Bacteriophage sp.]
MEQSFVPNSKGFDINDNPIGYGRGGISCCETIHETNGLISRWNG